MAKHSKGRADKLAVPSPAAEFQYTVDGEIIRTIKRAVKAATGADMSNVMAEALYEDLVGVMFRSAILGGSFRLPSGFGALRLNMRKATRRRVNGVLLDVPEMPVIKYVEGDAVRVALGKRDHYGPKRKKPIKAVL